MKIINLTKRFDNKQVLDNINLEFFTGELTFIVGKSGVGKSTLLNILGTLDKQDTGEILVNIDNKLQSLSDIKNYRGTKLGFVFQDSNLLTGFTVRDNLRIALAYSFHGTNDSQIEEILQEFDILYTIDQKVEKLSAGEKQRVAIARAVLTGAKIILADEPTGNLDKENSEIVLKWFESIKEKRILIIVTHDEEMAKKYGDRIIRLEDGKVKEDIRHANNQKEELLNNNKKYQPLGYIRDMLKTIFLFWKSRFKRDIRKTITIILTMSLSLAMILLMHAFYNGVNLIYNDTNVNYFESDLLIVRKESKEIYLSDFLYEDDIKKIQEEFDFAQVNFAYEVELYFEKDGDFLKIYDRQIEVNDFFEERVMSYEIEGNFITTEQEVIIAKDIAIELFGNENCIGKTINLTDGRGLFQEVKIAGVNNLINPEGKILSFVPVGLVKQLISEKYENINTIEILNIEEFNKDFISRISVSILGILEKNEEILYGELPKDSDEIILSYPALLYLIDTEFKITKEEFSNYSDDEKEELISTILSNQYVIRLNDNYPTKVVGIYNSNKNEIKIADNIYNKDIQPKVRVAYFYLTDYKDANDVRDVFKDSEYTYTLFAEHIRGKILNDTRVIQRIMVIIAIVLIVITIIQMNAFIKIRIIESEYDVGILKTLGAKGRHIFYIFSIEAVLLALSSTILSLIIYIFGVQIISSEVTNLSIIDFTLPGINILIIGVLACIISVLSVSKHLLSISRLSPIEAIRRR